MVCLKLVASLALLSCSLAHMSVSPSEIVPAGRETFGLTISHDCGTDTIGTSNFTVAIPEGMVSVTVEDTPGWKVIINEKELETPITIGTYSYTTVVSTVEFHGFLPDGFYKTFGIKARASEVEVGHQFWWMGYQECHGDGTPIAWATIPSPEDESPRRPARATTVVEELTEC